MNSRLPLSAAVCRPLPSSMSTRCSRPAWAAELPSKERILSAAYSPDGRWIVTASTDDTARVWSAESGQQKMVLQGHTGPVTSAAYSPDGRWIVTASDGTARVWWWGPDVEGLLAEARSRVARELTCQERVQYLHEDLDCRVEE